MACINGDIYTSLGGGEQLLWGGQSKHQKTLHTIGLDISSLEGDGEPVCLGFG